MNQMWIRVSRGFMPMACRLGKSNPTAVSASILSMPVDESVQRRVHDLALGFGAAGLHGLGHQFIIENDIGTHDVHLLRCTPGVQFREFQL